MRRLSLEKRGVRAEVGPARGRLAAEEAAEPVGIDGGGAVARHSGAARTRRGERY
jgi:hypothetical protein